ncbi:hypothetical protein CHLRE_01g041426v5 [Chlamydomonas reinhardtii]|uniref:Uncharacterized protein n=1 Tax=Chlamydomonas reinhardtii TaxID=3055 RepID=A0A2K3E7F5_CHLRE|nr:uncharacterized protein CHLRE_01g041426v5 [Chlamydomonas reinhardtii]PNW88715.1 hypothetical protein CHLRE_01g041426v5 [Chlamydomonas reinhardtii]
MPAVQEVGKAVAATTRPPVPPNGSYPATNVRRWYHWALRRQQLLQQQQQQQPHASQHVLQPGPTCNFHRL